VNRTMVQPKNGDQRPAPEAILFDLGNTLLEYGMHGRWRAFLHQRLATVYEMVCEDSAPTEQSSQVFAERVAEVIGGDHAQTLMHSGVSWPFEARLSEALSKLGIECDEERTTRVIEEFYLPIRDSSRPYPDTYQTLDRLKANGLKLAIISNTPWDCPGYLTYGDMKKWGIDGYFQAALFSGDLAWRKPKPEIMLAAASELRVAPSDCLVVGNDLASDIAGANAAEMKSVWVHRDRATGPEGRQKATPDVTVEALSQVADLVEPRSEA